MKHLFILCAYFCVLSVNAQGVCAGISATGPITITEAAPTWAALPCIPDAIGGTGKGYNLRVSAGGVVPWVWCPSGTGWALRWGAMTWDDAAPIAAGLPAALLAADKRQAIADLAFPHMGKDIASPELKALWCPHWAAMKASMPASPTPPRWVTSGLSAYNSVNGVLGSYAGSIKRGLACNDSIPAIRVGNSTYKNFTGATKSTLVAQCSLSAP